MTVSDAKSKMDRRSDMHVLANEETGQWIPNWGEEIQFQDESCVISHLSFDSVICKDIKQLVENFEPGKVATKSQNQFLISTIQARWKSSIFKKGRVEFIQQWQK